MIATEDDDQGLGVVEAFQLVPLVVNAWKVEIRRIGVKF